MDRAVRQTTRAGWRTAEELNLLGRGGQHPYGVAFRCTLSLGDFEFHDTKTYACGGQRNRIARFRHAKTGLVFCLIPGGTFHMGSTQGQSDEKPVHTVTVNPFLLSQTECTQAAWDRIKRRASLSDDRKWRGPQLPIERVSWTDARAFCKASGLRLPSEAEWEYACRAGTTTRFCFGDSDGGLGRYAWYDKNSGKRTHRVGQKAANAFGLFDMHGNVWEWCADGYQSSYRGAPRDGSARSTAGASRRVIRGGSWSNAARNCRSASRSRNSPGNRNTNLGFRPARTVDQEALYAAMAEACPGDYGK